METIPLPWPFLGGTFCNQTWQLENFNGMGKSSANGLEQSLIAMSINPSAGYARFHHSNSRLIYFNLPFAKVGLIISMVKHG
jgi:hypothetical protein